MLTNSATTTNLTPYRGGNLSAPNATQKVVIVNGSTEMLELLETVLDAGHYDVVFVESSERAYSQIKRVQPNLVILCVRIDEMDGLHVLSMLKLDVETKHIPVLTYTTEYEGQERDEEVAEPSDVEILAPKPAMQMN
ncbi:MAG TPA: response regulator [Vicinamibacterales bacterium]|jgi:PleD family two-component response regulator